MTGATAALLVTVVMEVPIVASFHPRARLLAAGVAFAANVVTNSLLNRVWLALAPSGLALATGELFSFASEALVYALTLGPPAARTDVEERARGAVRSIVASASANLASFLIGPVVLGALR